MPYRVEIQIDQKRRRVLLRPGENLVGADPGCEVVIDHPSISRQHAVLVVSGDRLQIADVGSTNGTFLDGHPVREVTDLGLGRVVHIGDAELCVEAVATSEVELSPVVRSRASAGESDATPTPTVVDPTASSHPLSLFARRLLPEILSVAARTTSRVELARACGQGVFDLFPVLAVRISTGDGLPLFEATRSDSADEVPHDARFRVGETELAVDTENRSFLELASPLLGALAELIESRSPPPGDRARQETEAPRIVSADPQMRRLYEQGARIAAAEIPVLITGESGTGKEFFARFLHERSTRSDRPLTTLNCAALPRDLLEAELFGIEQGVATGVRARPGCFERAHGGTLFLDEIGDMSLEVQAKVLRVLETGRVHRLGAREPRPADVRILSATHRNPARMTETGDFRLDLYYRLADWEVELPPLRERPADLSHLLNRFLEREAADRGLQIRGVSREAMAVLLHHSWPGNVRELEREIRRAVLLVDDGGILDTGCLSGRLARRDGAARTLEAQLLEAEKGMLRRALVEHGGRAADAAKALDVASSTFYRKLRQHGLRGD